MGCNPFKGSPFVDITQISLIQKPFLWSQYPHFHETEYEIAFALAGQGDVLLPGTTLKINAGDIAVIPPLTAHCYRNFKDSQFEYATIRFHAGGSGFLSALWKDSSILLISAPKCLSQIHAMFSAVYEVSLLNGGITDARIQILATALLECAAQESQKNRRIIETHAPVYANDILLYIQKNTHRKLTMNELSETFNLSASHLSRVFSKTYHISPINYLIYCRMRQARTYILNDHLSSAEIAKRLAYSSVYHFIHSFEQFYGCPPEEYRESEDSVKKDSYHDLSRA